MTLPIFVISMPNHPRRDYMRKHLADFHIPFAFFDATDGRALSDIQKSAIYDNSRAIKTHWALSDGEIGCAVSHKNIYQKMVDENINDALILEDDVVVDNTLQSFIKNYKDIVPHTAELLFLGHRGFGFATIQNLFCRRGFVRWNTHTIGRNYKIIGGAYAYYITQAGAKKMLQAIGDTVWLPADGLTSDILVHRCVSYMIHPPIVSPYGVSESTISPESERMKRTNARPHYTACMRIIMAHCSLVRTCIMRMRNDPRTPYI